MRLSRFFKSFGYAIDGVKTLFRTQANARIHLLAAVLVISAGLFFGLSSTEWCVLILMIALVISLEGVNTAIEFLTDLASPEIHPLAKAAKDVAAGAVLLSTMAAVLIGCIIFIPKVCEFLNITI